MNKFLRHITLLTIALLALASCDVHEYPGKRRPDRAIRPAPTLRHRNAYLSGDSLPHLA